MRSNEDEHRSSGSGRNDPAGGKRWQASHEEIELRLAPTERIRALRRGLCLRFRPASNSRHSTSGVLAGGLNDHMNTVSS